MKSTFPYKFFNWSIIILFLATLFPLLLLSFYSEPILDDYVYAIKLLSRSFLDVQVYEYMYWGSRYTATGILITNPIYFGWFGGYHVLSFLMIFLFVLGSNFMFYQISGNKKMTVVLMATFCFTYFFMLPDITSAFYWLAGSATYNLGNILSLFFIGSIIKAKKCDSYFYKIIVFVLVFLIIGCNEISMIYIDVFIFLLFVYSYFNNKKIDVLYLSLFIFAGALTLLIFASPGNQLRSSSTIAHHLSLSQCILKTIKKSITIIVRYFILVFIIQLLVLFNIREWLKKRNFPYLKHSIAFFIFLLLAVLFLGSFPSLWSVGFFPPLRTVNVIFFEMLIFSMIIAHKIVIMPYFDTIKISPYFLVVILFVIIFSYVFAIQDKKIYDLTNNLYHSYKEIVSGDMIKYKKEMEERYEVIRNSKEDTIYVKPIKIKPETIFRSDLKETNDHFYNKNMANFFGKSAIILRK